MAGKTRHPVFIPSTPRRSFLKKVHPRKHNDYEVLANSMMPEAYEHGGKLARVFTVLGFAVSVVVVLLERA
jgi:hypothetical protein